MGNSSATSTSSCRRAGVSRRTSGLWIPRRLPLLLAEAEQIGRERGANVVRSFVQGDDPVLRPVLEDAGWQPIRYSFQMQIDLDGELPGPEWPDGLSPRNLQPGEEERVYEAHMDAFADHWELPPLHVRGHGATSTSGGTASTPRFGG